ncbi:protein tweety isoform X1 [Euwallacea similis]|uniref:protein tweety isoform X1 n=1 Tax=Euwallacea similis TaxID=1736056 RepID=UPI00344E4541
MGARSDDTYHPPRLAEWLHRLPHVNATFREVDSTFDPDSPVYLESLGILASAPAAWLIFTLLILLLYLLTRCCDRKPRHAKSISALKVTLAIMSVLCCAAVGLGLYGNDDLHNGIVQTLNQARQIDGLVGKIKNQTEAIERQLRVQAGADFTGIRAIFDEPPAFNLTVLKAAEGHLLRLIGNNTLAANAAAEIRNPLLALDIIPKIQMGEKFETIRWPFTMAVLSVLLVLCVVLLVGVARHNRCALIAFSVCGLLAVIASYLLSSVYLATSVALGDLCMAPERFVENQASTELSKDILRHYLNCERARANPFTQRLREAKTTLEHMRIELSLLKPLAFQLFPKRGLEQKFNSLKNEINTADTIGTSLTALVDCRTLYTHYLRGARALCNVGLLGLTLMLVSAVLAGVMMTILVWVDSHTWIYIRKKKDYQQVNETDPYLPPPAASQAIAARTLQRSQGQFPGAPPDTPPPSYAHVAHLRPPPMHAATAPVHEAEFLLQDGCDTRAQEHRGSHMAHLRGHTLGRLPSHHHHEPMSGPNNGKYATLSKQCKTLESSDFY